MRIQFNITAFALQDLGHIFVKFSSKIITKEGEIMNIHSKLEQLLTERGWSRYRLSKESGLSEETLTNIFTRGTCPSIPTLQAICNGLKITLSQFFAENEMIEATPELKELFDEWVFLTPAQKSTVLQVMKTMKSDSSK